MNRWSMYPVDGAAPRWDAQCTSRGLVRAGREAGTGIVEYTILIGILSVTVIGVLTLVGTRIGGVLQAVVQFAGV